MNTDATGPTAALTDQTLPTVALSIRQPWAWLIIRPDLEGVARMHAATVGEIKDVENRSWPTKFRGRFLVHAAKGMTSAEYWLAREYAASLGVLLPYPHRLERGGVVGSVELHDCREESDSPWHEKGCWGFMLRKSRPLPFQACRGKLNFFRLDYHG